MLGNLFLKMLCFKTEFSPKACAPVAKGLGGGGRGQGVPGKVSKAYRGGGAGARCPRPKI